MTLKGVFFLLGQYIYGGNCYFVNGPTLSRSGVILVVPPVQRYNIDVM